MKQGLKEGVKDGVKEGVKEGVIEGVRSHANIERRRGAGPSGVEPLDLATMALEPIALRP